MDLRSISEFIAFVKDVDRYDKHLQTLKKQTEDLNESAAAVGQVKDIVYLREQAVADRDKAAKLIDAAKDEAEQIKAKAKSLYDVRNAQLLTKEAEADKKLKEAGEALSEAKNLNQSLNTELAKKLASLASAEADLQTERAEIKVRLEKLKSVMG